MSYRNKLRNAAGLRPLGEPAHACRNCTGALRFDGALRVACKRPLSSEAMGLEINEMKAWRTNSRWPFDYDPTIVNKCSSFEARS